MFNLEAKRSGDLWRKVGYKRPKGWETFGEMSVAKGQEVGRPLAKYRLQEAKRSGNLWRNVGYKRPRGWETFGEKTVV